MNRSTLRNAILILGLGTALIHFYLNIALGEFSVLFTLNGLGYLGLLAAFFLDLPVLAERRNLVTFAFIGYTVLTILAWIPGGSRDALGYSAKAIEVLLVLALVQHRRTSPSS
jgi:ABC-type microcin C transport system permease subunit YejB